MFDLSADGRLLLYSAVPTGTSEALNRLWVMETDVLNARPRDTGIEGALWAAWRPDGRAFACAQGQRTRGTPGWKAANNLVVVAWPELTINHILPPNSTFIYAWWGESWAWRPDGGALAYAHADEIGLVDLATPCARPSMPFRPITPRAIGYGCPHRLAARRRRAGRANAPRRRGGRCVRPRNDQPRHGETRD